MPGGASEMAVQHTRLVAMREQTREAVQLQVHTNFGPTQRKDPLAELLGHYR